MVQLGFFLSLHKSPSADLGLWPLKWHETNHLPLPAFTHLLNIDSEQLIFLLPLPSSTALCAQNAGAKCPVGGSINFPTKNSIIVIKQSWDALLVLFICAPFFQMKNEASKKRDGSIKRWWKHLREIGPFCSPPPLASREWYYPYFPPQIKLPFIIICRSGLAPCPFCERMKRERKNKKLPTNTVGKQETTIGAKISSCILAGVKKRKH